MNLPRKILGKSFETPSGAGYPQLSIKDGHIGWLRSSFCCFSGAVFRFFGPLRSWLHCTCYFPSGQEQLWLKTGLLTEPTYNVQYLATMHFDGDVCMYVLSYCIRSDQIISYQIVSGHIIYIYIYSIIIYHIHL